MSWTTGDLNSDATQFQSERCRGIGIQWRAVHVCIDPFLPFSLPAIVAFKSVPKPPDYSLPSTFNLVRCKERPDLSSPWDRGQLAQGPWVRWNSLLRAGVTLCRIIRGRGCGPFLKLSFFEVLDFQTWSKTADCPIPPQSSDLKMCFSKILQRGSLLDEKMRPHVLFLIFVIGNGPDWVLAGCCFRWFELPQNHGNSSLWGL